MENIICKKFFPYLNYQQENILSSLVHYGLLLWLLHFSQVLQRDYFQQVIRERIARENNVNKVIS